MRKLGARHGARHGQAGQGTGVVGGKARTSFKKRIWRFDDQVYVQIDLNFTSRSPSILRADRSQLYVQIDLNSTSRPTSILRPDRSQFYVQIKFNFTSRSTSILRPDRLQFGNCWRGSAPLDPPTTTIQKSIWRRRSSTRCNHGRPRPDVRTSRRPAVAVSPKAWKRGNHVSHT